MFPPWSRILDGAELRLVKSIWPMGVMGVFEGPGSMSFAK